MAVAAKEVGVIEAATGSALAGIQNPDFRAYARMYDAIERDFLDSVSSFGLDFAEPGDADMFHGQLAERIDALATRGLRVENGRKSLHLNWISPACLTCRQGMGTETFLTSTQCPRNCYFCFNPNQVDYEYYLTHVRDVAADLQARHRSGVAYRDLAITGGEPLLHVEQTVSFFEQARTLYPQAYTRLYTSGAGLNADVLDRLEAAGLSEIRFSVKLDEPQSAIDATLAKMQACQGRVPAVMVEMPVMPDQVPQMKGLLLRLDDMGIQGINLLELCFPLHNAPAFAQRGYRLKARPYRVLYNYFYAGGLPVAGSEEACIELLEFALDEGLHLGVHYCSLENKFTGQVYQQNRFIKAARPWHAMSERDYFLKSAKVFGRDVSRVERALRAAGEQRFERDKACNSLEFPVEALPVLAETTPNVEVAVCFHVAEQRERCAVLRELAIYKTTPSTFDLKRDF